MIWLSWGQHLAVEIASGTILAVGAAYFAWPYIRPRGRHAGRPAVAGARPSRSRHGR